MVDIRAKVAIIHPWFPQYRESFFSHLLELCTNAGVELHIFYGDPPPEWADRGDSVESEWATHLETRFISVGRRSLGIKSLREFRRAGPYDLVILEQAIRNLETYQLLFSPKYRQRVAWWGHGRTYTATKPPLEERLKSLLTRIGCWFFAYTAGGAQHLISEGFPKDSITVVQNSIDTTSLQSDLANVREVDLARFRAQNDLRGKTALFIGGLDASKRLSFLFKAASAIHDKLPDFRLIIAGNGEHRGYVERFAADNPWCIYIGSAFGSAKALPMRASEILAMPGRVGLVAVDSFAAGLPIVTTDWPFHAPEFDYLVSGMNASISKNSVDAFAESVVELLESGDHLDALKESCLALAGEYSVETMAHRFCAGILRAVGKS